MSKITKALDKAKRERELTAKFLSENSVNRSQPIKSSTEASKKGSSLIWILGIIIFIVILIVLNANKGKDAIPLTEIFPEEEVHPIDVEYEFVKDDGTIKSIIAPEVKKEEVTPTKIEVKEEVEVKEAIQKAAIKEAQPAVVTAQVLASVPYTIQVASFKDQAKAQAKASEIKGKGYSSYVATRDLGEKGIWYRVYVGQFDTRSEANDYHLKVKQDYPSSFIIVPKK